MTIGTFQWSWEKLQLHVYINTVNVYITVSRLDFFQKNSGILIPSWFLFLEMSISWPIMKMNDYRQYEHVPSSSNVHLISIDDVLFIYYHHVTTQLLRSNSRFYRSSPNQQDQDLLDGISCAKSVSNNNPWYIHLVIYLCLYVFDIVVRSMWEVVDSEV